jgi:hypothetical protein
MHDRELEWAAETVPTLASLVQTNALCFLLDLAMTNPAYIVSD